MCVVQTHTQGQGHTEEQPPGGESGQEPSGIASLYGLGTGEDVGGGPQGLEEQHGELQHERVEHQHQLLLLLQHLHLLHVLPQDEDVDVVELEQVQEHEHHDGQQHED